MEEISSPIRALRDEALSARKRFARRRPTRRDDGAGEAHGDEHRNGRDAAVA